ncbi:hypothetical protein C4564_00705 [Candidatus Microgenomates bacterium]|nr:MAG: hypothetical protein C4564_00705 [Candidatus Microgenomates bacterium]
MSHTMKKILYANHRLSPLTKPHLSALRTLGYIVEYFDYYSPNIQSRVIGLLQNTNLLRDKSQNIKRMMNQALVAKVKKIRPDYVIVNKGLEIENQSIFKIKQMGVVTVNWFPDFWEFLPWMKQHGGAYDYFFDPDLLVVQELKKKRINAYYLPYATNPDASLIAQPKKYNLVFVGQWTKRREELFSHVRDLGLAIWGYKDWQDSSLRQYYHGFLPRLEDVFDVFRAAKIVLNVVTGEKELPIKAANLRVFEVCGVGSFLLNWYCPPINNFFVDGKEIVNFRTKRELREKILYYLNHEKERENIARKGWRRVIKGHTFEKRFQTMFSIIDQKINEENK